MLAEIVRAERSDRVDNVYFLFFEFDEIITTRNHHNIIIMQNAKINKIEY